MKNKIFLRAVFTAKRNQKFRTFYIDRFENCLAATCCSCSEIFPVENFYKCKGKKFGLDSRCKKCCAARKTKTKYVPINFDLKIKDYIEKNNLDGCQIKKGKQKNGYIRHVIINKNNLPVAFTCCTCLEVLHWSLFSKSKSSRFYKVSNECDFCSCERNKQKRLTK